MTPSQLRTFATIVRLGSSKAAAADLGVSEAAVSNSVAALRKELGDPLFERAATGIAFTPGGLRLAARAAEMLGLQEQTVLEVRAAAGGRRIIRVAVSPMFGELAAPGLVELFAQRALDLDVELSVRSATSFPDMLQARTAELAFGPLLPTGPEVETTGLLRYQLILVVAATHPLAGRRVDRAELARITWLLGPSAAHEYSSAHALVRRVGVPEDRQLVFQSHAAALEEVRVGAGLTLIPAHHVSADIARGRLAQLSVSGATVDGLWAAYALPRSQLAQPAQELLRFASTPRAIQAMLKGSGANIGRFQPRVHVTLWSGG